MKLPTFKEQKEKIIQAYFRDEIKPFDAEFCFCGTLCNNSIDWFGYSTEWHRDLRGYKGEDFVIMEKSLWSTLVDCNHISLFKEGTIEYEDALFAGMVAALDALKQIHIEHGEIIDETLVFKKRKLVVS